MDFIPSYRRLSADELKERAYEAKKRLASCTLCPWECKVNRLKGELGHCRAPGEIKISSYSPHFGEEPELVGLFGSGTIFFTHCNLDCIFCQNWDISQAGEGEKMPEDTLSQIMIKLQDIGCHNINLVTPTPHIGGILEALCIAAEKGLNLPLVYNCGGYESLETLKLLDGIIDIYMPDFKYWDEETAQRCSGPLDYPQRAKEALQEMYNQVGDLKTDGNNVAYQGLIVRHLVLPENLGSSEKVIDFLKEISPQCAVNIMRQYHPAYKAFDNPPLNRPLKGEEYRKAKKYAAEKGLHLLK